MPIKIGERDFKKTLDTLLSFCSDNNLFYLAKYGRSLRKLGFQIIDVEFEGECQDYVMTKLGIPQYGFKNYGSIQQELIRGLIPELKPIENFSDGNLLTYYYRDFENAIEDVPNPYVHYGILKNINNNFFVESKFGDFYVMRHPLEFFYHGNYVDMYKLKNELV